MRHETAPRGESIRQIARAGDAANLGISERNALRIPVDLAHETGQLDKPQTRRMN